MGEHMLLFGPCFAPVLKLLLHRYRLFSNRLNSIIAGVLELHRKELAIAYKYKQHRMLTYLRPVQLKFPPNQQLTEEDKSTPPWLL